uniref:Uncharacterized protein n=1 Tax=Triticum urartu TaxID=4572 RepID=A0A8R7UV76_TRIUA
MSLLLSWNPTLAVVTQMGVLKLINLDGLRVYHTNNHLQGHELDKFLRFIHTFRSSVAPSLHRRRDPQPPPSVGRYKDLMLCAAPSTRLLSYRNRLRRYSVAEASRLITYTSRPGYTRGSTKQLQLSGDNNNKMKLLILLRRAAVVGIFVRGSTLFERFQRRSMFPRLL